MDHLNGVKKGKGLDTEYPWLHSLNNMVAQVRARGAKTIIIDTDKLFS
jgi:hypothetical protein